MNLVNYALNTEHCMQLQLAMHCWYWAHTGTPRPCYTCFEHIHCVGGACIASFAMDICEKGRKHLVVHAYCFPSYQLASSPLHQKLAVMQSVQDIFCTFFNEDFAFIVEFIVLSLEYWQSDNWQGKTALNSILGIPF